MQACGAHSPCRRELAFPLLQASWRGCCSTELIKYTLPPIWANNFRLGAASVAFMCSGTRGTWVEQAPFARAVLCEYTPRQTLTSYLFCVNKKRHSRHYPSQAWQGMQGTVFPFFSFNKPKKNQECCNFSCPFFLESLVGFLNSVSLGVVPCAIALPVHQLVSWSVWDLFDRKVDISKILIS